MSIFVIMKCIYHGHTSFQPLNTCTAEINSRDATYNTVPPYQASRAASMESSYGPLLERTKLPQSSLQRHAVAFLFRKLKDDRPPLGLASDPGRKALSLCLCSTAPAVADQAVRELCHLIVEGRLEPSEGLVELQSALEGCDPLFVPVFVKGIGFLCRFAFRSDPQWGRRFDPVSLHPFVKVCPKILIFSFLALLLLL